MMKINYFPEENEVLQKATTYLNECLKKAGTDPVLLVLSGGSALQIIDGIEAKYLTRHMTVVPLDERYSHDEKVNNFAQIAHTGFYRMLQEHGAHVIDTRIRHEESQEELENRYEKELRKWIDENPKGKIVATLGMGEDGHIAGIMPYEREVDFFKKNFQSKNYVAAYDAKNKNPHPLRVTTTLTFLKKIDCAVMYVVGKGKKEAFDNVIREKGKLHTYPARIIHEMKDVQFFTDRS